MRGRRAIGFTAWDGLGLNLHDSTPLALQAFARLGFMFRLQALGVWSLGCWLQGFGAKARGLKYPPILSGLVHGGFGLWALSVLLARMLVPAVRWVELKAAAPAKKSWLRLEGSGCRA